MEYFRLYFYVLHVSGENGGCLYDLRTGKMIYISAENDDLLKSAESNEPVDRNNAFFKQLYEKYLGDYYRTPVVIEKTRLGVSKEYDQLAIPKTYLNHAFIQVTNDCDGNCVFCDNTDLVYTKTRCKKWSNPSAAISDQKWQEVFRDLKNLKCEKITFIGGNPLLRYERMEHLIALAKKEGVFQFEVYTNLQELDAVQIRLLKQMQVAVNVQVISLAEKAMFTDIRGKKVLHNIQELLEQGIPVRASVLVTGYNEEEVMEYVSELRRIGVNSIKIDFYYENADNHHYSRKYLNEMYERQFLGMDRKSFTFLEKYNNCLYGKTSINLSGNVTPCPMMNRYVLGNIREQSLLEILADPKYYELTKMTGDKIEKCKDCAFRTNCIDCRALESQASGKINGTYYCKHIQKERERIND